MRTSVLIAAALAASLSATSAYAATFVNSDKAVHKIEFSEGGKNRTVQLDPNKPMRDVCQKGCKVSMGGQKLSLKGTENVTIKNGKFATH